jgi:hypothetical protein
MTAYTFDDLDELGLRGRVFSEMFPGTAASDAWRAAFIAAHSHHPASDPSEGARKPERDLDETLDETFPASDPPANTVETGIRVGATPQERRHAGDDRTTSGSWLS